MNIEAVVKELKGMLTFSISDDYSEAIIKVSTSLHDN